MIELIVTLFRLYEVVVVVRVILSWIQVDSYHPAIRLVYKLTEPLMAPIRNLLPTERIGIDFSPLIVLFALELVKNGLIRFLYSF
jgi:YggT family protein